MKTSFLITCFLACALGLGPMGIHFFPCLNGEAQALGTHNRVTRIASKKCPSGIVVGENLSDSEEYKKLQKEIKRLLEEIKKLEKEAREQFDEKILPIIRRKLEQLRKLLEEFNLKDPPPKDDDMIAT
jgi:hypothetical protein